MARQLISTKGLPASRKEAKKTGSKYYFTGIPCKHGHLEVRDTKTTTCRECRRITSSKYEKQRWADPEKRKKCQEKLLSWKEKKGKEFMQQYWKENRDKQKETNKVKNKEYKKNRLATDPHFKEAKRLSDEVNRCLRGNKIYKTQETKDRLMMDIVGCNLEFFTIYIEKLFQEGMSWENRGFWHLDHIRPVNTFDLTDKGQAKVAYNYRNYQPLWKIDNERKTGKYDEEQEFIWVGQMRQKGYKGELYQCFSSLAVTNLRPSASLAPALSNLCH